MVWCGVVWCGVVWCGVVWCGVVSKNSTKKIGWMGMSGRAGYAIGRGCANMYDIFVNMIKANGKCVDGKHHFDKRK